MSAHLALLSQAGQDFLRAEDPHRAFDSRYEDLARLIDGAWYEYYVVGAQGQLERHASRRTTAPPNGDDGRSTESGPGEAICRQVARTGHPIFLTGIQTGMDTETAPLRRVGCTAYAAYPLLVHDRVHGILALATTRAGGWNDDIDQILRIISLDWSAALARLAGGASRERLPEQSRLLQQSREKLRSLAAELAVAEERERRHIAQELQQQLAQPLTLGRMKLSHIIRQTTAASISALLHDIDEVMDQALKFTESFAVSLSPPVLHEQGFQPALQWLAGRMSQQGLAVALRLSPNEPKLDGNQTIILFQSVRELLFNVLKHAGTKRASVTVTHQGSGHLGVTVQDEGRGFHPGAFEEPGDPHSRFGLFTVRERMAELHGRMEIHSLPDHGTSVSLVVPTGLPAEAAPLAGKQDVPERLRVLLVDDHAMVREGLRSILEAYQDLEVVGEAGDGMEAIKLARTRHPDVVVMDINMPRLDGVAATRQIKRDLPATAVIGISVQDSSQMEQAMLSAGAAKFLTKDRAASQLHDAILAAR